MTVAALDLMPFIWVAVITLSVVLEIYSKDTVVMWFTPSAAAALAMSFMDIPPRMQTLVFFIVSAVLILLSKVVLKIINKNNNEEKED